MHHVLISKRLLLIFCMLLIIFGCGKSRIQEKTESIFTFTAKATPEGIILNLGEIPENAIAINILLFDITGNEKITHEALFFDTLIFPELKNIVNDLAELRKTRFLLCPFAKDGHEYIVRVAVFTNENMDDWVNYEVNVIAEGGIYIKNNPQLYFCDENKNLTLSTKPIFSKEIHNSSNYLFNYSVKVFIDDEFTPGGARNWNELIFPADEIYNASKEYFGFTGYFPVVGYVRSILIFENIEWLIGIANTDEINILF